jgi:hypothetical protein
MDTRIAPGISRMDVVSTDSALRVTPPSGVPFKEMVSRGASAILRGAEAAVTSLPGAPIVAAAVRPGGAMAPAAVGARPAGGAAGFAAPGVGAPASVTASGPAEGPAANGGPAAEGASVESALAQSQEFNLYYLQLQEQLAAENRAYSAMSNVLKARHDTVKNAIGNIR